MTGASQNRPGVVTGRSGTWDSVRLISPDGCLEATFLPGLGMVGSSLRHQGEELLGQRNGPEAYAERKSTFGIPLLHPWANRLGDWGYERESQTVSLDPGSPVLKRDPDTGLPIHGALAACPWWEIGETGTDQDRAWLEARLDYGSYDELLAVFPFAHRLRFQAWLTDAELSIRLTLVPTDPQSVPIAFGFHPYIALPGSRREEWEIALPVASRATLDDRGIPTGAQEQLEPGQLSGPLAERSFDDGFESLTGDPPVFAVADGRRRVEVRYSEGYPVAQVYAPRELELIAFEPMTAPVDALRSGRGLRTVAPEEEFSAQFSIAVTQP